MTAYPRSERRERKRAAAANTFNALDIAAVLQAIAFARRHGFLAGESLASVERKFARMRDKIGGER